MDLGALARGASTEGSSLPTDTWTALVVRADESGLWVVPTGDDPRHPVGPCRGGWTANGTRVPVGAVVALVYTSEDPWVVGFDNPALAINDGTLAPFPNPSFEIVQSGRPFPSDWSDFWSSLQRDLEPDPPPGFYYCEVEEGNAAHGLRSLRTDANETNATIHSGEWSVPAGSSVEVSVYARGTGVAPRLSMEIFSNVAGSTPGPFAGGAARSGTAWDLGAEWLRYRATITVPPTHTRLALYLYPQSNGEAGLAHVWIDNADVDLVEIDPAAAHQDFIRRAEVVLAGGGTRTVTAGGTVTWSQPFTIAGVGRAALEAPDGRFEIALPPNGTVIPVHSSAARTSLTVAGGVISLNADDALWYELPLADPAASQAARFHVVGSTSDDGFVIPPHWILVVRRTAWSSTAHAPEFRWGDSTAQDPWRTPDLNAGWIDGTIAPRFTKTQAGLVVMRGRVRSGAGSAFTLPPGYFPTTTHEAFVRDGLGAAALLTVSPAGVVTTAGNNADHSIATTFAALGG